MVNSKTTSNTTQNYAMADLVTHSLKLAIIHFITLM